MCQVGNGDVIGAIIRYGGVSGGAGLEMAMSVVVVVVLLLDMVVPG